MDIQKMAQAADLFVVTNGDCDLEDLERFATMLREACAVAAWSAGMDYHSKMLGMPTDAREVGSAAAKAIRAL